MTQFTIDFNIRVNSTLQKELKKSLAQTKKVNKTLKKTKTNIKSLLPSIRSVNQRFGNMRFTLQNIRFLLLAIGGSAIFVKAIKSANDFERQMIGLNLTATQFGSNTQKLTKAVKELAAEGMIPLEDITLSLRNLMIITNGDVDKSIDAFRKFRDTGSVFRQGHLELGQAIRGTTEGLKDLLSIKADNIGISENISTTLKREAKLRKISVDSMSLQEKRQIALNFFMKESVKNQGAFNSILNTTGGQLSQTSSRFSFFLIALGETVTKSKTAFDNIKLLNGMLANLTETVKKNKEQIGTFLVSSLLSAALAITTLVKGVIQLISTGKKIIFMFRSLAQSIEDFFGTIRNTVIETITFLISSTTNSFKVLLDVINKPLNAGNFLEVIKNSFTEVIKGLKVAKKTSKEVFDAFENNKVKGFFSDAQKKEMAKDIEAADEMLKIITGIQKGLSGGISSGAQISKGGINGGKSSSIGSSSKGGGIGSSVTGFITKFEKIISSALAGPLQGAAGVGNTVGQVPIFGAFLKQMGEQNEEQVRENVRAFTKAIPEFAIQIAKNIPVIIEELIAAMPMLAEAMTEAFIQQIVGGKLIAATAKGIVGGLKKALGDVFKSVGKLFSGEILKGANKFVEELIKGAGDFVKEIINILLGSFGGKKGEGILDQGGGTLGTALGFTGFGGFSGLTSSIGNVTGIEVPDVIPDSIPIVGKFANGGTVGKPAKFANGGTGSIIGKVPSGFPADTFAAALGSGETVITRDTTSKLDNFLERQSEETKVINVRSDINEKTLIDTIIRLKRNGQLEV